MPATLAFTPGDPAGIGPDLAVTLSNKNPWGRTVIIADENLLAGRADLLGHKTEFDRYQPDQTSENLEVLHIKCPFSVTPGKGDHRHMNYMTNTLDRAIEGCLSGEFDALVTGPVNKEMMQRGGFDFMGHTEYLADKTGSKLPVMVLMSENLRIALVTTHVPLSEVSKLISCERIVAIGRILHNDFARQFGIESPRIGICGLNPHAGEGGELGHEEISDITPAIQILQSEGINALGPYPADTIFAPHQLSHFDVVLTMYHDQGLPVIKHVGFGKVVNVTLGLPIIRTSVDHGTAYDIAGKGIADPGSLKQALKLASQLSSKRQN